MSANIVRPERMPLRWHAFAETVYDRIHHPPVGAEHPPTAIERFCVRSLVSALGSFIWSIADQLRGPYRPNQYGTVILPLTILRRLDCIIEPDREAVRELAAKYYNPNRLRIEVKKATGRPF